MCDDLPTEENLESLPPVDKAPCAMVTVTPGSVGVSIPYGGSFFHEGKLLEPGEHVVKDDGQIEWVRHTFSEPVRNIFAVAIVERDIFHCDTEDDCYKSLCEAGRGDWWTWLPDGMEKMWSRLPLESKAALWFMAMHADYRDDQQDWRDD